ncbi:RNA-binding S4 domain-containing protein [Tissierella carlieri]|uniref:RNA-binding S4 domain-containing protein n=1 Tax=Tissierella carlieri TaxID=689904 RepID=A0ABT1SDZ4_9FIRM|nr:RNA-binding S4 domain-containing protein [Tissierella carlieri]MBU5311407.1 RNA-binding S4 domain-containing protein [Tissierella carlieri]MCQ4924696.1 RNA-binding S4 domain-containing protein [Tissierella carlieri]
MKEISIETDYIKLDQFLKLAGITQTGGQAKIMISEGSIIVNNEVILQRGKKIRKNDIVEIKDYGSFVVI